MWQRWKGSPKTLSSSWEEHENQTIDWAGGQDAIPYEEKNKGPVLTKQTVSGLTQMALPSFGSHGLLLLSGSGSSQRWSSWCCDPQLPVLVVGIHWEWLLFPFTGLCRVRSTVIRLISTVMSWASIDLWDWKWNQFAKTCSSTNDLLRLPRKKRQSQTSAPHKI